MPTGIQWTDATWNPVVGCSVVSPGCENCYAARMDKRIRGIAGEEWKPWTAPNAAYNVRLHPERLEAPLHWRKPRRVFVNSMSDLFHEQVPDEFIDRVFAVMALTPQHTYQVLTKRPERMRAYIAGKPTDKPSETGEHDGPILVYDGPWPLPNVWLGVSCEDQRRADERIPLLLQTPAAVRFISAEPLLDSLCLLAGPPEELPGGLTHSYSWLHGLSGVLGEGEEAIVSAPRIDWVIVGGESGPGARPCDIGWIRSIVEQCKSAAVPVFVKQLGAKPFKSNAGEPWAAEHPVTTYHFKDNHGGDPEEWPTDLRVRQFPQ